MTSEDILNRLDKLQLELEESKKNKVEVLSENLLLLLKFAKVKLAEREISYGIDYKSGIRSIAENLVDEMEKGKKLNIKYEKA